MHPETRATRAKSVSQTRQYKRRNGPTWTNWIVRKRKGILCGFWISLEKSSVDPEWPKQPSMVKQKCFDLISLKMVVIVHLCSLIIKSIFKNFWILWNLKKMKGFYNELCKKIGNFSFGGKVDFFSIRNWFLKVFFIASIWRVFS